MHSKNNNKTLTFIQGLRPFSSSIPKTLKKHLRKGSYNYSNIIDNWTKMVSKKISNSCYPIAVKIGKEMEIEYEKNEIMDKINSFFGYNCISKVTLKIVQDKIHINDKVFPKIKNLSKIEEKMSKVDDMELKSSLNNFLKAFNERNK